MKVFVKSVTVPELYAAIPAPLATLFEGITLPWEVLPKIGAFLKELTEKGLPGYTKIGEGILVGENVKIAPTAVIEGVCVIGPGTEIRPGAYLRGNVFCGEGCVLGNSSEFKNCILFDKVQAPHYNYVGDSILGFHAHMGAGSICSNLRSDGKNVVIHGETDYETGLRKIGAFLGDRAEIGCGSVLNPGSVVGPRAAVYPLTPVRGVVPADVIVKNDGSFTAREER